MAKNTVSTETATTPESGAKSSTYYAPLVSENVDSQKLYEFLSTSLSEVGKAQKKQARTFEESLKKLKESEIDPLRMDLNGELIKLRDRSDRTIETIGIFAALLSFVTFEAQIFKSDLNGFTLIGLSSLLLGALLIFVFALSNAFDQSKRENWKSYLQPLVVLPALLVLFGLGTASVGYKTDSQETKEIEQIQDEIKTLKLQYSEDDIEIMERINKIENTLNELSNEDQSKYLEDFKGCIATRGLINCL